MHAIDFGRRQICLIAGGSLPSSIVGPWVLVAAELLKIPEMLSFSHHQSQNDIAGDNPCGC
jgi:hypothetical protein